MLSKPCLWLATPTHSSILSAIALLLFVKVFFLHRRCIGLPQATTEAQRTQREEREGKIA
ncbi:hypothetical protein [Nostoc sp. ChiVER01]|uniref:hypothetical protein n=1 Tax=Nostoc sp. ChiVER01 TaxID=3075382 RepID=UPI002AD27BDC|nr:hypothetical protein [Nostoc sp. ChiVER01]MDZ8222679.1 hypothetical protein [Nostoc sp. ChiVER01]